jgi:hypothetical protein
MLYLGIVLLIIGVVMAFVGVILSLVVDEGHMILFMLAFIPGGIGVFCLNPQPNVDDLQNGKAQYILTETHRISETGDTLSTEKTYNLVWKEEFKPTLKRK